MGCTGVNNGSIGTVAGLPEVPETGKRGLLSPLFYARDKIDVDLMKIIHYIDLAE